MTVPYVAPFSSESLYARSVKNRLHSSPKPPFFPKISGVKVPCSNTRSIYSRFFSLFVSTKYLLCRLVFRGLGVNMRYSNIKKSSFSFSPKTFAFMSTLASSILFSDLRVQFFIDKGIKSGSAWTSVHTLFTFNSQTGQFRPWNPYAALNGRGHCLLVGQCTLQQYCNAIIIKVIYGYTLLKFKSFTASKTLNLVH